MSLIDQEFQKEWRLTMEKVSFQFCNETRQLVYITCVMEVMKQFQLIKFPGIILQWDLHVDNVKLLFKIHGIRN